jgi:hypothetical protein
MSISTDALIFGLGYLKGPRSRLSFGGEGAEMRITPRAREALDELVAGGFAETAKPDCQIPGRESYRGISTDPHLGELAKAYGIDPWNMERWTSFESIPEDLCP